MPKVYALSIKQPWAALLVTGQKTIEVRSWQTRWRGRILIHAARVPDPRPEAWQWVTDKERSLSECAGGIIGEAILESCIHYRDLPQFSQDMPRHLNDSNWFQTRGLYGFVFRDARSLPFRQFPGNVRLFTVEEPE